MRNIVVISGIRDLAPQSHADVEIAVADAVVDADEMRFGGALGVDTVALVAAREAADVETALRVFVPGLLAAQPRTAIQAIKACADEVVELGMRPTRDSYLRRNDAMLKGASRLWAFTDGRTTGGTAYTIERALATGVKVETVQVAASTKAARTNPELFLDDAPAPVFAMAGYVSATTGKDWISETVRALKAGNADPKRVDRLAAQLATYILEESALRSANYLVPMPRRDPHMPSDLLELAEAIGRRTDQDVLENWLVRTRIPKDGEYVSQGRRRFPPEEHAATLSVTSSGDGSEVILLDNVLTTRGTMVGAQRAVLRDTGVAPVGLAVLYSVTAEAARHLQRRR